MYFLRLTKFSKPSVCSSECWTDACSGLVLGALGPIFLCCAAGGAAFRAGGVRGHGCVEQQVVVTCRFTLRNVLAVPKICVL